MCRHKTEKGIGTASRNHQGESEVDDLKTLAFEAGAASRLGGHTWEDVSGTLTSQMGDNQMIVVTESESTVYGLC